MSFFRFVFPSTCAFLAVSFTALQSRRAESKNLAEKTPRIAVIGSGIGGSATAYFIREIFGENAQISVFEKADRVGGRLATLDFGGDIFEAGGSIIHPRNLYMKQFVKELGLEKYVLRGGVFSLYDGEHIVFSTSSWSWLSAIKLLWRYGFSLIKMQQTTKDMLKKFEIIYTLQENGEAFNTVADILDAMNKEFYKMTQVSAREYLLKLSLSELLIDELVTAITRINYGQSPEVNAFTGMVSLAGAEPNLWAVQGGNWRVCEGLLKKSSAILNKNTQIIEIIKKPNATNEGRPLYFLRSAETLINTPFDVVVVAVPLEVGDNFIGCSDCNKWPSRKELGHFQQTIATFVNGTPNEDIFNCNSTEIGTMEKDEIFFNSIGKQTSVNKGKESENKSVNNVWKIFSRKPLSQEQKEKLFPQAVDTKEVNWLAYPHYTPPEKFLPFVFDDGVFYVNAIEWAASAMEMSSLSAKNAALLTSKYLKKTKTTSRGAGSVHEEL